MKKLIVIAILICLLLTSGCAADKSKPEILQEENRNDWEAFSDLSGAQIDFSGTDVKGFDMRYAIGWSFDSSEYKKLYQGDKIGEWEVTELASNYYIQYESEKPLSVICNSNQYTLQNGGRLSGILVAEQDGLGFYPYPDKSNDNFLFVCERNADSELAFNTQSNLAIGNNEPVQVQPIRISIGTPDSSNLTSLISTFTGEASNTNPQYFEAEISFSEITFFPYSVGDGAGIEGTRAIGYIASDDDIIVKE